MDPAGLLISIATVAVALDELSGANASASIILDQIKVQVRILEVTAQRIHEWLHWTDPISQVQVLQSLLDAVSTVHDPLARHQADVQSVTHTGPKTLKLLGRTGSDSWLKANSAMAIPARDPDEMHLPPDAQSYRDVQSKRLCKTELLVHVELAWPSTPRPLPEWQRRGMTATRKRVCYTERKSAIDQSTSLPDKIHSDISINSAALVSNPLQMRRKPVGQASATDLSGVVERDSTPQSLDPEGNVGGEPIAKFLGSTRDIGAGAEESASAALTDAKRKPTSETIASVDQEQGPLLETFPIPPGADRSADKTYASQLGSTSTAVEFRALKFAQQTDSPFDEEPPAYAMAHVTSHESVRTSLDPVACLTLEPTCPRII
ncbi:hypothetical protein LTR49_022133 [Elasticomyces elasticus]|nr:hypothetical protein LTR49_022133 [Elasticomyces elasticus]